MQQGHRDLLLGLQRLNLKRKQTILIIDWQIFEPKGKGIKIKNISMIDTEIEVEIDGDWRYKYDYKEKSEGMFHRVVIIQNLEWRHFCQN